MMDLSLYPVFLFSFVTLFFQGGDDLLVLFLLFFQFILHFHVQLLNADQFLVEEQSEEEQ